MALKWEGVEKGKDHIINLVDLIPILWAKVCDSTWKRKEGHKKNWKTVFYVKEKYLLRPQGR